MKYKSFFVKAAVVTRVYMGLILSLLVQLWPLTFHTAQLLTPWRLNISKGQFITTLLLIQVGVI